MHRNTRKTARRKIGIVVAGTAIAGFSLATTASASTAPGGDYCAAHVATEEAFAMGDPAMMESAAAELVAAAPPEIAEAVGNVLAHADEGPFSPEFNAAYTEVIDYVKANCGFGEIDVVASEYSFGGIPEDVPAGPTVISLTNSGEEVHEMFLVRRNDGDTTPTADIIMMSEGEAMAVVTPVGQGLAMPGETGYLVVDLAPGNYIALCFLPVGATPEMFEQMMSEGDPSASSTPPSPPADASMPPGSAPMDEAPFHANHGMIMEFTVTE